MKILNTFGKNFGLEAKTMLDTFGEVDYQEMTHNELLEVIDQYDIIVVGILPMIDKEAMDKAKKIKYIVIPSNTLENIEVEYAESKGIKVLSLWEEKDFLNTITGTAELACGLMIDIVRATPWSFDHVKNYKWEREKFRGHNLYGKTLGIVGMGRLENWMAKFGKAFGMNIIFYDPYVEKSSVPDCKKIEFLELLNKSDIISIHAHLNKETEEMFNKDAFKKMKDGVYLINTARGKIVDEVELLNALQEKKIAGYATDVLAEEFYFDDTGLRNYPLIEYAKEHQNIIITPHIGGMTIESRERTDIFIVEKLRKELN